MKWIPLVIGIFIIALVSPASAVTWTSASGCWTAYDGTYNYTMWNATGEFVWTVPAGITTTDYLVVAGGGSGGGSRGAGGGAGGILNGTGLAISGTITGNVGTGGVPDATADRGGNGTFSLFDAINATGGGAGGSLAASDTNGLNGGSGGGAVAASGTARNWNSWAG